jgi:hypothetical protein
MKLQIALSLALALASAPVLAGTKEAADDAGQKIHTHAEKVGEGLSNAAAHPTGSSKTTKRPFLTQDDLHKDRSGGASPAKKTVASPKKKGSLMEELHRVRG